MRSRLVFVDANVLFSAAYKEDSRLGHLWSVKEIRLITSLYAMEEAKRNLVRLRPHRMENFQLLIATMEVIPAALRIELKDTHGLPLKDIPILQAAVHCKANFLLTGDLKHFSHLVGKEVEGVLILTPAQFLANNLPKSK